MTTLKERFHDFGIDDEDEVVPLEDFSSDQLPASNAFRTQGLANLEQLNREQAEIDEFELIAKRHREQVVAERALENAGVYVTLEEHRQNQLDLVDIASDISMYKGGEKGGYKTEDFQGRYTPNTAHVEKGARTNHAKVVNRKLPEIYKAKELKDAGFNDQEVDYDAKTQMRVELMAKYGGPQNKKARAAWRKDLKSK